MQMALDLIKKLLIHQNKQNENSIQSFYAGAYYRCKHC